MLAQTLSSHSMSCALVLSSWSQRNFPTTHCLRTFLPIYVRIDVVEFYNTLRKVGNHKTANKRYTHSSGSEYLRSCNLPRTRRYSRRRRNGYQPKHPIYLEQKGYGTRSEYSKQLDCIIKLL